MRPRLGVSGAAPLAPPNPMPPFPRPDTLLLRPRGLVGSTGQLSLSPAAAEGLSPRGAERDPKTPSSSQASPDENLPCAPRPTCHLPSLHRVLPEPLGNRCPRISRGRVPVPSSTGCGLPWLLSSLPSLSPAGGSSFHGLNHICPL